MSQVQSCTASKPVWKECVREGHHCTMKHAKAKDRLDVRKAADQKHGQLWEDIHNLKDWGL
eukprot:1134557-Pelagomonas_calceolata.AAC.1